MPATSLEPLIKAGTFERGTKLHFADSYLIGSSLEGIVQHAKSNYLILSFTRTDNFRSLLGSIVRISFKGSELSAQLQFEVMHEETVWPVSLIGMLPLTVEIEKQQEQPKDLIKPDFIISVPYKRMGAKPNEEKGEGVLLEFSPDTIVLGTDGYLSKGEFINISFGIPRSKQEMVIMTKVVDKRFEEGSSIVTLHFSNIDEKYQKAISEYYEKVRKG